MKQIMQLKITLNDFSPKIWRRIQVPATYTFWDVHCAIQNAMGWTNAHLHAFYIANKNQRGRPTVIELPHPELGDETALDERKERMMDWFPSKIKQCIYTYDMGDSWDHAIVFEKLLPATEKQYPVCITGKNACPPEDCGGVGGYMDLLSAITNTKNEDDELREWMGLKKNEMYDPTKFSPKDIVFEDPKVVLKHLMQY